MPIFAVLQAGKSTYGGQPVWYGSVDNPQPFTISNLAVNGNIYIGSNQGVGPNNPNESTPIAPGGFLSFDGTQDVYYVIADQPNVQAIIYPGVVSVFQPGGITLVTNPVTNVTEDASSPAVVHIAGVAAPSATTAAFTPPANSWLVAIVNVGYFNLGTATITVSDTGGHSWSQIAAINQTGGNTSTYATIWRAPITTAPGSITVTAKNTDASATSFLQLTVRVDTNANANQSTAGNATSAPGVGNVNQTGNIVTTKAGSLVYIATASTANLVATAISGTTLIDEFQDSVESDMGVSGKSTANTTTPGSTSFGWTVTAAEFYAWAAMEVIP